MLNNLSQGGVEETIQAKCALCGNEMEFVEGDVIFGEKWFHKNCVAQANLVATPHSA